eukprot:m.1134984 g.1134984  ORF g.1134984 m.1134984 type:complete len:1164 (+) comp24428_c1_seq2:363-3854(+)
MASKFERQRRDIERQHLRAAAGDDGANRFLARDYASLEAMPQEYKAKRVTLYANGDIIRSGTQFTVPKACRDLTKFRELAQRTVGLLGNCRRIFTHDGIEIYDVREIEHGHAYVVAGSEPFKQLKYQSIGHKAEKHTAKEPKRMSPLHARDATKILAGVKCLRISIFSTQLDTPSTKLIISPRDLLKYDSFLEYLTRRVQLPPGTGAIRNLYDATTGKEVAGCNDIINGGGYIAAGGTYKGSKAHVQRRLDNIARGQTPREHQGPHKHVPLPVISDAGDISAHGGGDATGETGAFEQLALIKDDILRFAQDERETNQIWATIKRRSTDASGHVSASLSALAACVARHFPILDNPAAWEYAQSVAHTLERIDGVVDNVDVKHRVRRSSVGRQIECTTHVLYAMLASAPSPGSGARSHPKPPSARKRWTYSQFKGFLVRTEMPLARRPEQKKVQVFESFCEPDSEDKTRALVSEIHAWFLREQLAMHANGGDPSDGESDMDIDDDDLGRQRELLGERIHAANRSFHSYGRMPAPLSERHLKELRNKFDVVEKDIKRLLFDPHSCTELFDAIDGSSNFTLTLAELHAGLTQKFPLLAHKGALLGAFRCATSRKGHIILSPDGDISACVGDCWVNRGEMARFVRSLFYCNKLYQLFEVEGTGEDFTIDFVDFKRLLKRVRYKLPSTRALVEFQQLTFMNAIPANASAQETPTTVLFDVVAKWYATSMCDMAGSMQAIPQSVSTWRRRKSSTMATGSQFDPKGRYAHFSIVLGELVDAGTAVKVNSYTTLTELWDHLKSVWKPNKQNENGEIQAASVLRAATSFHQQHYNTFFSHDGLSADEIFVLGDPETVYAVSAKGKSTLKQWLNPQDFVEFAIRYAIFISLPIALRLNSDPVSEQDFMRWSSCCVPITHVQLQEEFHLVQTEISSGGAGGAASNGQTAISHRRYLQWVLEQLWTSHYVHMQYLDTEKWIATLGSRTVLKKYFKDADRNNSRKVTPTQLIRLIDHNSPMLRVSQLGSKEYYDVAMCFVTGAEDRDQLTRIFLCQRDFRRVLFLLFCISKISKSLQITCWQFNSWRITLPQFRTAVQSLGIQSFENADDNTYASAFYRINQHEHNDTPLQDVTRTTLSMRGALMYLARLFYKQNRRTPDDDVEAHPNDHELIQTYA